jgi:hypothetical protein
MKYILAITLLAIGILTLLKMCGHYLHERMSNVDMKIDQVNQMKKPLLILGSVYIFLAFGILFNYITYGLIWLLDPLPDGLIFNFINFSGIIDPMVLNRIMDTSAVIYPHEQTIYYCVAFGSFRAFIDIIAAIWLLVNRVPFRLKMAFSLLIGGVITGILLGFTTCLPFFL